MKTEQIYKCEKCLKEFKNTDDLNLKDNGWICGDCEHKEFKDKYELITDRHNTEETALIINNYPYGFRLRTNIKYWIETTNKGDRFISMTLNPKTNLWNKPKKSIYNAVMVLAREKETGYIRNIGLYPTTDRNEILRFLDFIGDYDLSKEQQEQIRIIKAYSKTYENVSFEIETKKYRNKKTGEIVEQISLMDMNDYEELDDELTKMLKEKQQQEVKENINKSIAYHYHKQDF